MQKVTEVFKRTFTKKINFVDKLAELCTEGKELLQSHPAIFGNEQTCELILSAIKCQTVDDPILIMDWDFTAFNQQNGSRDNDSTHTLYNLIQYIKGAGGIDVKGKNIAFVFKNGTALSACIYGFPSWSHKIADRQDVVYFVVRINKLDDKGNYEFERCDYPLKRK